MCSSKEAVLEAGRAALKAIEKVEGVIAPFDICSAASKPETNYPWIGPTTNHPYCPSLKKTLQEGSMVPEGVGYIPEIVINGLNMMKRGCDLTLLNFNNCPYTPESNEKILKIHKKLKEYASGSDLRLYQMKYGGFLKKCEEEAPPRMTCVLCKSGMYQIAEKLAQREKAFAIIDGSSVGQVASQTLPNILATRYSTSMPILSPLIGLDKVEISEMAKKIGTYEISILPEEGCSAAPKHPETNAVLEKVVEAQETIGMEAELDEVFSTLKRLDLEDGD